MSETILDLSNVINVSVIGTPTSLGIPNINTAALITLNQPIVDFDGAAFRIYTNASDVLTDFGDGIVSGMAAAFFAQQPNPLLTGGYLAIIPRLLSPSTEDVKDAITRTLNLVYYFGIIIDASMSGGDFATLTTYIQTLDKMFFYASGNPDDYAPGGLFDLWRSGGKTHSRGLYYNDGIADDTSYMAAAYCGRALSTDFTGSNTTQTMHLKVLSGVTPDQTIDQTELEAVQAAGVDVYVNIAGTPSLFTSGENSFFDEIYNELWFKFALQTAGYNYLRSASTKIPQTESGMEGLKNVYRKVCEQAVSNGFIGPGSWTSSFVFGNPESLIRSVANIGYYVYSKPVSQQSQTDREARQAPLVQIAVKAQGAIHKSNVLVFVNL